MVFWKSYPVQNIIKTLLNTNKFQSLEFKRDYLKSPTGIDAIIIDNNTDLQILLEIKEFIKHYFGNPPKTPILDISENMLLNDKDLILIVRDKSKIIVGCIRYHYLGEFISDNNQEIFCEDCFCIHPSWRKKGIGDYLLNTLHRIVNKKQIPYSMFLKEGRQLSIFHQPFYTGKYVYRSTNNILHKTIHNTTLYSISIEKAYILMDIFYKCNPNLFIIRNKKSKNQIWKLYINKTYKVLACIQDTYQYCIEDGILKKIGWITCWIETPNMIDEYRIDASNMIVESMHKHYNYIWANKNWIGNMVGWKDDGLFHWYLYQWITNINIKRSYCILN